MINPLYVTSSHSHINIESLEMDNSVAVASICHSMILMSINEGIVALIDVRVTNSRNLYSQ